jgi:uncharacterized delta-60 repeat protein
MKPNHFSKLLLTSAFALVTASTALADRNYLAWARELNNGDPDTTFRGVATAVDSRGYVVTTGYNDLLQNDTWLTTRSDALTGQTLWSKAYTFAAGDAHPTAIATDSSNNVIVAGYTSTVAGLHDFYVIKYNEAGTILWSRLYNNANANGNDEITALVIDSQGSVIVTGSSVDSGKNEDFFTIKYTWDGNVAWAKRYSTSFLDRPNAIALAPNGDVLVVGKSRVAGGTNACYLTVRYAAADGTQQWTRTQDSAYMDDDEATSVAVDSSGSVVVTGTMRNPSAPDYVFLTIKYDANGAFKWASSQMPAGDNLGTRDWWPHLGLDKAGNVLLSGTNNLDGKRTVFFATKYNGSDGTTLWEKTSAPASAPAGSFITHLVTDMLVDTIGDAVVTGYTTSSANANTDYLTMKFHGGDGRVLWQQQLNGNATTGEDKVAKIAQSDTGDIVVTGTMKRSDQGNYLTTVTARYNRLTLSKGDPVSISGQTAPALINSLNAPATMVEGSIVTALTVKNGTKILNAIVTNVDGSNRVTALQGQDAPGVMNAKFATFTQPVCSTNNKSYAFSATLTGAPTGQTSGVWTTMDNGNMWLAFQVGKQAPGLAAGVLISSILNFAQVDSDVVAHITLKGTGVTTANNSAVIRMQGNGTGMEVLRSGAPYMIDGKATTVKLISIFSPPAGSAGHGRYVGGNRVAVKATLADGRTALLNIVGNSVKIAAVSGGAADQVAMGAKWKSFNVPGISDSGTNQSTLATLTPGLGGVTTANDTTILFGNDLSMAPNSIVREGGSATGINGGSFVTLGVPVSNAQLICAFTSTVKGTGITTANNVGVWVSNTVGDLQLVARTGSTAPDAFGVPTTRSFAAFQSIALPAYAHAPIIRATLKGTGVTTANNSALFVLDHDGYLRQLLRTGDKWGALTVKSFTLLSPVTKAMSASRSFNRTGDVTALVTFTNLTQSIVTLRTP